MFFLKRKIMTSPAIQATNLVCSEVSDTQLQLTLQNRGNGRMVLITGRLTATTNALPDYNTSYTPSAVFGSGEDLGGGVFALYVGNDVQPSITVTNLDDTTSYTFHAYEFNVVSSGTEKYNSTSSTGNPVSETTLIPQVAPSIQSEDLVFAGDRRIMVETPGNGLGRLIVYNLSGTINASFPPLDGEVYEVGDVLGGGNIVGAIGSEDGFDLPIMPFDETVAFKSYEYNIASGNHLFNITDATDNPISASTPADEPWYLIHETPFQVRKSPYTINTTSRATTQIYPICITENADNYHGYSVTEGADGQDYTSRLTKSKTDGLPINQGWTTPTNALGDPEAIIDGVNRDFPLWDAGTPYTDADTVRWGTSDIYDSNVNGNLGNNPSSSPVQWTVRTRLWDQYQCWGMGETQHGGSNRRLWYCGNSGSAQRYGIGYMESADNGETYARYASNPIIASGSGKSYYYCHPYREDATHLYLIAQNYNPSELTENHLYVGEIHFSSNDGASCTKISTGDIFANRGLYGAVDIGQPWKEGSRYYAFISYHDQGVDGGFRARSGADDRQTTYPVGKHIALISWDDWANFNTNFIFERVIFSTSQAVDIDARTWCAPITYDTDKKFVLFMSFLKKCQTLLTNQNEPVTIGKFLTTENITDQGFQYVGREAYPGYVYKLFTPHQSQLNDTVGETPVLPRDIIGESNGTVVGSPLKARLDTIQAVDNGFVTFPNFSYDPNYFAVKVLVGRNALSTTYGICGMDTDVVGGTRGWHIRKSGQYRYTVYLWGDNTNRKQWEFISTDFISQLDTTEFVWVGFVFRNGDLKLCFDLCTDIFGADPTKVTKHVDASFTAIQQTDEVMRIGAIYPTTNNEMFSQDVVGKVLILSGIDNATESNWLNTELL